MTCKRYNSLSYKYPKFTDIPKPQMKLVKPFDHLGIDFTSHIYVKSEKTNTLEKMYLLIFTCLHTRAVHFEVIPSMNTKDFLLAFQRFSNTYYIPSYIYSDNARYFVKGGDIIKQSFESDEFKEEISKNNIKHIKIPLFSPWVGSKYERLIKTTKTCLYKSIGKSKVTYFELITTLTSIKNVLNSRPITYRENSNTLEAITPNSFLKLHNNSSLLLSKESNEWKDEENKEILDLTLEKQNELYEYFKHLWYNEYLLSLRESARDLHQTEWFNKIKVGDIVLIKDSNKPRPFWKLGKVVDVILGFDNNIRSVRLKQANGEIGLHSICNLYPMELSIMLGNKGIENDKDNDESENKNEPLLRPKRKA